VSVDEILILLSDGRLLRTPELSIYGLNRVSLSLLMKRKLIAQLSRGVYIRSDIKRERWIQLAVLTLRVPQASVGLVTAVEYHLGREQTHPIWLRLPKGKKRYPTLRGIDVDFVTRSEPMFSEDVRTYKIHGVLVSCTSLADSVAECFVFRSRLGINRVLDVLETYLQNPSYDSDEFYLSCIRHRVATVVAPYLLALNRSL
jgi:hypothetical protein